VSVGLSVAGFLGDMIEIEGCGGCGVIVFGCRVGNMVVFAYKNLIILLAYFGSLVEVDLTG
jgi:hypothetical protein